MRTCRRSCRRARRVLSRPTSRNAAASRGRPRAALSGTWWAKHNRRCSRARATAVRAVARRPRCPRTRALRDELRAGRHLDAVASERGACAGRVGIEPGHAHPQEVAAARRREARPRQLVAEGRGERRVPLAQALADERHVRAQVAGSIASARIAAVNGFMPPPLRSRPLAAMRARSAAGPSIQPRRRPGESTLETEFRLSTRSAVECGEAVRPAAPAAHLRRRPRSP
jgi:hypothetical protein